MSQISNIHNPWRDVLLSQPASFRGVIFHVETGGKSSGRRTVTHEYPKRDDPYAEDMGRVARHFQFTAYLVYRPWKTGTQSNPDFAENNQLLYDYVSQRTKLYNALEADDAGTLIHPVFAPGSGMLVMCERFTMSENRERGGYTQFDMQFVEAGTAVSATGIQDNTAAVKSNAAAADQAASNIQLTGRIRTNPDGSPITGPPQQFFRQLRR